MRAAMKKGISATVTDIKGKDPEQLLTNQVLHNFVDPPIHQSFEFTLLSSIQYTFPEIMDFFRPLKFEMRT